MIRTAILAGIFLVLLSIGFTRNGQVQGVALAVRDIAAPARSQPVEMPQEPVRKNASVETSSPARRVETSAPPAEAVPVAPVMEEAETESVLPIAPPMGAVEPPMVKVAQIPHQAPVPTPQADRQTRSPGAPIPLVPPMPAENRGAPSADALAGLLIPSVSPKAEGERQTAGAAPPANADLPIVNVPTRPVVTPWYAPQRSAADIAIAAPQDPGPTAAAQTDTGAPKFMTPDERSRDLHQLAREMEETFISKLAR